MNASDPNFFFGLLLVGAVAYGLAPAYGAGFLILAFLWLLAQAPLLAIALAILWCLRWLIADFFFALVGGFGADLGLRGAGVFRDGERKPQPSLRDRWRRRTGGMN